MNKYKSICLIIFIVLCSSFYICSAKEKTYPLLGKIIYIDPGHGGRDPGAVYKDIYEKEINLDISLKIVKKLESLGATVYMTRYGDYDLSVNRTNNTKRSDLSRRSIMINESKADMYISVHLNSDPNSTYRGLQIFYDEINKENKNIAESFQIILSKHIKNIKPYKKAKNLYLYKHTLVPGILLEVGFLSNSNDRYMLKTESYQEKIATLLSNSVNNYYNH